ncbi:IS982 family transposase [Pontibacter beigongshangensis]
MTAVLNTTKLTEIFIACDDFMHKFKSHQLSNGYQIEPATQLMSESEMMAIVIFYHHSGLRCFKYFYELGVRGALRSYFPACYSYSRFVGLIQRLNLPLFLFLCACRLAAATRGNYVDATKLVVCHNKRSFHHRVFQGLARRGKSSTGWFFGLKLHAVINELGQLVVFRITSGNVADNNPQLLGQLTGRLQGFLYGDAGYISSIAQSLRDRGLELITKLRKNMQPQELTPEQKHYLRHRGLIESVFNLLKKHCDIDHTRHRSPLNFFINLWGGLIAYSFMDKFPSMPQFLPKAGKGENTQIVLG